MRRQLKGTSAVAKEERKFVKQSSISGCLKCSVCMEVFFMPTRLYCGHTFCYECINSCIAAKPNCPMCRAPVQPANAGKDLLAYNIINELEVFCIYEECSWKGEYELLQLHLSEECLLHSSSETKRERIKAESSLKPILDEEVEEKINENINKGSLISRAIKNDDSLKAGNRFDIARKMLQTEDNAARGRKKSEKKEKQDEYDYLMELFQ